MNCWSDCSLGLGTHCLSGTWRSVSFVALWCYSSVRETGTCHPPAQCRNKTKQNKNKLTKETLPSAFPSVKTVLDGRQIKHLPKYYKKPGNFCLYEAPRIVKFIGTGSRMVAARGLEGSCLTGAEFQSGMMKAFWRCWWWCLHMNALNAIELYT